jgi:hypothetical protein
LSGCTKSEDASKPGADAQKATDENASNKPSTARQVLESMAAAYRKAKTYKDKGMVRLYAQGINKKTIDDREPFEVAFERPNKFHLSMKNVEVRCDGKKYYACIKDMAGQLVVKDAPPELNIQNLYGDMILQRKIDFDSMISGPLQPFLLLENDALAGLLRGADEPSLADPCQIEGNDCYRVKIPRIEGRQTYCIDKKSYILRRIEFSTEAAYSDLTQRLGGEVQSSSLVADFTGASFDTPVPPVAFEFEVTDDPNVKIGKWFTPSLPGKLIGKEPPAFRFTDGAGKDISPESLRDKVGVMLVWSPAYGDNGKSLEDLQKICDAYKDKKVEVFAVCLNEEECNEKAWAGFRQTLKLNFPLYRDQKSTGGAFEFFTPVAFLFGTDGSLQEFEIADDVKSMTGRLQAKIDQLLAGKSLAEQALQRYQNDLKEFDKAAEAFAAGESPKTAAVNVAPRLEPSVFKLKPLWKCADVANPGNILIVNEPKKSPKILVVSPPNVIAEVDLGGKAIGKHALDLLPSEMVANLRAFTTSKGNTYVAAFAAGNQRLHLLDLQSKQTLIYPQDALKNPHSGLADVELHDLDGDGTPELYVGFLGVVGVHALGLDGKPLWTNRSAVNVIRMIPAPANEPGDRKNLVCVNILDAMDTSLVVIDSRGRTQGSLRIPDRGLRNILSADLAGNGLVRWCATANTQRNEFLALGFDLTGRELWHFALPNAPPRPLEPIVVGRLDSKGPSVWLLPSPDGTVDILSSEGKPVDHFNIGSALQGIATTEIDGKPTLLLATPAGLEAFEIEYP